MTKTDKLRCACAQIEHKIGDPDALMRAHEDALRAARADQVDLLVFPETSLTGYPLNPAEVDQNKIKVSDARLVELAEQTGDTVTIVGFMENADDGRVYNAMAWLRQGRVLAVHRKINLPTYGRLKEGEFFGRGPETTRVTLPGDWQCGGLICADFWDPGLAYLSALAHDDLIALPFASTREAVGSGFSNVEGWQRILSNHALVYGMPILACNWVGELSSDLRFWGGSSIYDAKGHAVKIAGSEPDLLVADIGRDDIDIARKRLPTIRDLSPGILAREIALLTNGQTGEH